MPHIIVEYTANLSNHIDIENLLKKINEAVIAHKDIFPIGGIRSRAYKVNHYQVADGKENDAFVHTTLKIGKGRTEKEKSDFCESIFEVIKDHFNAYAAHSYLALSLELFEFHHKTYKSNNIHHRFS
ncbi:5-carboxymethyl-2-hydroxymuconate Delta-isomerase [Halobacillus andaensis]|uniref:5-carboxymethyl-2-hydroxymuconate Delta-isomerase n=1 Tax=Halobacillus andaensis TaxID=1176239 RepID=UPI003D70CA8C